jgi:hypothetical protein
MNVTAVESSTLATIGYDRSCELLQLEFNSHAIYQYFGVPATVHGALLFAPSKGSYFNRAIRGKFRYIRVADDRAGSPEQNMAAGDRR